MEFPNERHHHHRHHQRDDDEERQNYPPPGTGFDQPPPPPSYYREDQPPPSYYRQDQPPPSYYGADQPPPPPLYYGEDQPPPNSYYGGADRPPPTQVSHVSHSSFHGHPPPPSQGFLHQPPPPQVHSFNYQSEEPTPPVTVHHVAHQAHQDQQSPAQFESHHTSHTSHLPSFHPHASSSYFSNKPTFRVFTKADPNFSLAITEGKVILARSHETDDFQHWYKDEKYSTSVKDEERFPSFALVNKATGQALKHSIGATHPVQLIPYNPDILDESILWTESADLGDGFRTVRMVNNIRLNLDAFHGDKKSGGVHDGTIIVLWNKNKGDNQRWKIVPY
ncbi:PREDICTED: extensin [Prunus mume]|uniref:Extensin n=1 Tax=Prunus mume TaxID=102107 RepID=A0ABM0PJD1_PRUMU|nr:PREDICTED: extensin [Prunus mume]